MFTLLCGLSYWLLKKKIEESKALVFSLLAFLFFGGMADVILFFWLYEKLPEWFGPFQHFFN